MPLHATAIIESIIELTQRSFSNNDDHEFVANCEKKKKNAADSQKEKREEKRRVDRENRMGKKTRCSKKRNTQTQDDLIKSKHVYLARTCVQAERSPSTSRSSSTSTIAATTTPVCETDREREKTVHKH